MEIEELKEELNRVESQINKLDAALDAEPDYGLGEGDPAVTQREVDRALLASLRERAETLRQAIAEMSDGTYGLCKRCGERIHPDRLAILPDTTLCVQCAQKS